MSSAAILALFRVPGWMHRLGCSINQLKLSCIVLPAIRSFLPDVRVGALGLRLSPFAAPSHSPPDFVRIPSSSGHERLRIHWIDVSYTGKCREWGSSLSHAHTSGFPRCPPTPVPFRCSGTRQLFCDFFCGTAHIYLAINANHTMLYHTFTQESL